MRMVSPVLFVLLTLGVIGAAQSQELTKEDAQNLILNSLVLNVGQKFVEMGSCGTNANKESIGCFGEIPIGTYKLGLDTENLTRFLKRFEQAGLIKMTPIDARTGNVFQDLANMSQNPMSATVKTELAPDADQSQMRSFSKLDQSTQPPKMNQVPCFRYGKAEIKEIVRFDKIHGTGADGIGFDGYVMQGIYTYQPASYELRFEPSIQTNRKFQVVFKYDPFSKRWYALVGQGVGISEPFDAALFARKLGNRPF